MKNKNLFVFTKIILLRISLKNIFIFSQLGIYFLSFDETPIFKLLKKWRCNNIISKFKDSKTFIGSDTAGGHLSVWYASATDNDNYKDNIRLVTTQKCQC